MIPRPALARAPSLVALSLGLAFATAARADDLSLELKPKALKDDNPALIVKINKPVMSVRVKLTADNGAKVNKDLGAAERGKELKLELPHRPGGTLTWRGSLDAKFRDGSTGSMPLQFQTERVSTFKFQVLSSAEEIREKNRIVISMQRPCSKVEVEVYGERGKVLANESQEMNNAPPGQELVVEWEPKYPEPPLHVRVRAFDADGVFSTVDSFPYFIDIPHEEVEFESGKADVRPGEAPKLQKAIPLIEEAVGKYEKAVKLSGREIRLFILGHTDTVGGSGYNQGLSLRRARSIARWFLGHGVTVPIYVRGFGESMLKVETPDDTDEAANRRADYRVAADSPTGSLSGWSRVK